MNSFLMVSGALFVLVFFTRALPFLFSDFVRKNRTLKILAPSLPLAVMTLLMAHGTFSNTKLIPSVFGVLVTAITHLSFKQTFISIFAGTSCYLLIINIA